MNKIFKTKYDVTTGQTKVVSELANNRQVASRVEGAGSQPKCGVFFGGMLGAFKVLPLALVIAGILGVNNLSFAIDYIEVQETKVGPDNWYLNSNVGDNSVHLYGWKYKHGNDGRYKNFTGTVLIGAAASIGASNATAIGYQANAKGDSTISIGKEAQSLGTQSVALGNRANAKGEQSLALGADSNATGYASIALGGDDLGDNASTYKYARPLSQEVWNLYRSNLSDFHNTENYATTKNANPTYAQYLQDSSNTYSQNWAKGKGAISIGSRTIAYGNGSTSIGTLSIAKGDYSTAMGAGTLALGNSSIALGNEAYVYAVKSVGIGNEVQALSDGSMVYGLESYAGGTGSIAIGTRALSNVKMKTNDVDGVYLATQYTGESKKNKRQITAELGQLDQKKENLYQPVTDKQEGSGEFKAQTNNTGAIAIGYYVIASGENSVALGRQAYAEGNRGIAIGPYAYSKGSQSFALGYGAKALKDDTFAIGSYSRVDGENSIALGIEAKVLNNSGDNNLNGENSLALGNNTEVTMKNSVALGYKSTTKYYYKVDGDKKELSVSDSDKANKAIDVPAYIPKGTSYNITTDANDGVISFGGWDKGRGKVGLRRLVNVAAGALDSDVATVGQLRALEYAKKEGVVAYYTKQGKQIYKVVKGDDGSFYKANTTNGTPFDKNKIDKKDVFAGPKGANEKITTQSGSDKAFADLGEKIKFAHILDGEITSGSDQAITGNQLKNVGDILGITVNTNNTKFDNPSFTKVKYNGAIGNNNHTTFKSAIDEIIIAINKGLNFKAGNTTEAKQLGDTLEFIGDSYITPTISNKKIKYSVQATTTLNETNNLITSKAVKDYVDPKFTHYVSIKGTGSSDGNYGNNGAIGKNSIAIGVGASTDNSASGGIAIGNNAQSKAKNAVVIGTNVSIDVPNSFVLGSDNIVTQTGKQDRKERAAVVVIGSGTTLTESKSAIAIGAVNADGGTKIEYAAWTASIGNKNKIKNGTDIIALGNNIDIGYQYDNKNNVSKNDSDNRKENTEVIAIGNSANANKASGSVLIGAKTTAKSNATQAVIIGYEATAKENATQTVVIGKSAESSAAGAVVIGEGATATVANSVAIGKGSKTTGNTSANGYDPSTKTAYVGSGNANTWKPNSGVFSVGDGSNTTRRITGVAAGSDDTDAVNVAQLKKVVSGAATLKYKANGSNEQSIDLTSKGLNFKDGTYTTATVEADGVVKFDLNRTTSEKINNALSKADAATQYAKIDGSNITGNEDKWREKLDVYKKDEADSKINEVKTALNGQINGKVDTTTFEAAKTQLETKIDGKADKTLGNIDQTGQNKIKGLAIAAVEVKGKDGQITVESKKDADGNKNTFTVSLNENIKTKIESIGTGKVEASDNNTVTGGKVYTAIEGAKSELNAEIAKKLDKSIFDTAKSELEDKIDQKVDTSTFNAATFGLMGNDSQAVTKTLNNTIKIEGSESVESNKKNIYVSKNTAGDGLEIKLGETLTGITSVGKDDKAKISFGGDNAKNEITYTVGDTTATATFKFSKDGIDLGSKKITNVASGIGEIASATNDGTETNLDKVLKGSPEDTYKSNAANVEDLAKVSKAIIDKGLSFESDNGKVTRKVGETLKIVGEKATDTSTSGSTTTTITTAPGNIKVTAKKSDTAGHANDTLEIGLSKDLTGIESITKGANKAKLTLGENTASLESATNKSKIELKDDGISLTTNKDKTIIVKDNELSGVNKISTGSDTNANSIDLANSSNVVITSGGKALTIAKDGAKDGISLTGLADRKVDDTGYGTNGSAGRAATESALLDLKTKGLTFEVNEKNTDSKPKTLKRELGETLKITGKDGDVTDFDSKYSLENVATKIDENNKAIRIGLLKTPRFDALELGTDETKKISLTPEFANGNELKLTLTGTGAGNNTKVKISGVANGTDDNDAINKSQLDSVGNATLTFSDGTSTNDFVRKNSDSKKVVISSGSNVTVTLDKTKDNNNTGQFTVSLNKDLTDINSITLKSNGGTDNTNNKTGKITVDTTGDVKVQHGDGTASKIVVESDFNELKTSEEITVTGGGKVLGAETTLSLNDNSIAGTKLKTGTISEDRLDSALTTKLNREFKVKVDTTTSENLIGNTLEFAKDSNLTVVLDSDNKKITYGLSPTLTGITSIESAAGGNGAKSKITLNADHIVADKDIYVGSKGNDESNKLVKKSELTSEISTITKNITNNINTLSENKLTFKAGNTSFERANNTDKNIVFKGEGNVNIKLATDDSKNTGTFTISVNETNVIDEKAGTNKNDTESEKHADRLTTEKAVVDYVKARTFKLAGNDSFAVSSLLDGTINIKGDVSTTSDQGNIYVSKGTSDSELKIQLGKNLTGIESIKKSENGAKLTLEDNKLELSPEKDVKVTLEKDGQKTTAKATGLSTIGNDGDNALVFNTGKSDKTQATLKVAGEDLTFTKLGNNIQISNLASGLGLKDSADGNNDGNAGDKAIANVLAGNPNGMETNAINVKDLSEVAKALVKKGLSFEGNGGNTDKVTRKLGETLKIVGETSATTPTDSTQPATETAADNIIVAKKKDSEDTLEVKLSKNLNGIASITNGDKAKIALDDTSATLSAGKDKGSIKVATGSGDDANKIELSPDNGSKVTLAKDGTNGVKATGLSTVGLDGDNALVFTNGAGNKAELKVGGSALTFTKATTGNTVKISNVEDGKIDTSSTEAITGKQLHDLASKLGVEVESETGFKQPSFTAIKGGTSSTGDTSSGTTTAKGPITFKGAIDDLITAVNGGLTFEGNVSTSSSTTLQLGGTLTIDSSESKTKLEDSKETKEKDITTKLESLNGSDSKAGKLTLTLNKATSVDENDERVVTSSAVANKLKNYTTTETLEDDFLRVTGENINGHQKEFGKNVGLEEVKLEEDETEGTSELVQAKALVDYLKGTGEKSVKLSDSSKTQAIGEGSISIGHNAVSRNEGSIAMGYNSEASNSGAISIGQGSTVLGTSSVAVGKENNIKGNFSFVLGEGNTLDKEQTYVIGSDNKISGAKNIAIGLGNTVGGNENIVLGSHVDLKDDVEGAIVLGDKSIGVSNAVSVGNALTKRRIVFVDTPQGEYDAVNKKYVDDLTLTYKSNNDDKTKKSINLKTEALDFVKSENISVSVEADGKITHTLNNNLISIVSISGGKNGSEDAAKITLSSKPETEEEAKDYVKTVTINDAKLKGLLDGEIAESSKEAVTGKQLADLTKQLGVDVNTSDKTKFNELIFEYLSKVDGSFKEKNPTTLKEAIDETRAKLNEGLKFGGDIPSAGTNTNNTHYLGSTINIIRLGMPTETDEVAPTSTSGYSGSNLITQYTYDKGNAKIEIGFKDAPEFRKVTLSKQTYGDSKIGNEDVITKSYLEQALNSFKFNVAYDNKTVQIGRGDTLKFENGLNIQGNLKQEGATQPSAVTSTTAPTTVNTPSGSENGGAGNMASSGNTSPAVASSGSDAGDTGATVGSSTTPTTAPINNGSTGSDSAVTSSTTSSTGAGTDGGSGTSSTASSGATPSTTTAGTASSTPSTTSNTTAVVTIGTTEDLTGLKSAEFNGDNGNTTNITGNEIVLKDQSGNAHTQTATSQIITDNTDPDTEKAVVTTAEGVTMSVVSDDQVLVNDQTAEANILSNGKNTTEVKAGEIAIKDKVGQNVVSLKVAEGEDGQDGKGATLAFAKGTDSKSGTGTIKGLADIKPDETDGSLAVNKNYVDKLDKVAVKYDDPTKSSITLGGKSAKNYRPVVIDNLKSGLGIDDIKDGGIASVAQGKQGELVKDLVAGKLDTTKDASGKAKDNLHKAVNLADLKAIAQAGLNFAGNDGRDIHKNLSETLAIVGQGLDKDQTTAFKGTNGNIAVKADNGKLSISLNEALTGLKSAEFNGENGNTTNITGNAIALKDDKGTANMTGSEIALEDTDGASNTQTAKSHTLQNGANITDVKAGLITVTENPDTDTEKSVMISAEGMTTAVVTDDKVLVNDQTAEANILSNGKHTTEVKAGEVAIKDKAGKDVVSLKVAKGEDGQDGKGATLAFAKGADDKGTGTITGLKDLDATADGSSAANKNYVDEKVSDLDSNRPFDFYIKEGNSYTKVIKGRDGKFYDPKDLEGAKYDGSKYVTNEGTTVDTSLSAEDKVIIRAEPTTAPIGISNVASGLDIDAEKVKQAEKEVKAKRSEAERKATMLKAKAALVEQKEAEITALEQEIENLSGDEKTQKEAELKAIEAELSQFNDELATATKDLKTANDALKIANNTLTKLTEDKIGNLVKGENINPTNGANIGDLQAVARAGLNFEGNDGVPVHKNLGEKLTIKGEGTFNSNLTAAGNIKVEMAQDGKGLEVKLSDQLKNMTSFETREVNGKKARLDSNGLSVENTNTKERSHLSENRLAFFKDGALGLNLDGKDRALKVGEKAIISINGKNEALVEDLNASSSGQAIANKNYVDAKNNELRTQLHSVNRESRSGIAGANAAAALPMIAMPGKSALAVSAGAYKGQSAVALGYSRMSDNGKIMLKLHGNSTSTGDFGGGVGIGWAW
uniref:Autotransporter adhesin n=1 Tax=Histophilus somni (strain 129Pt) TaxID=205914 RepID=Q0I4Z9_HISS1